MSTAASSSSSPPSSLVAALADCTSEQIVDMIAAAAQGFHHTGAALDEQHNAGLRELITDMQTAYLAAYSRP